LEAEYHLAAGIPLQVGYHLFFGHLACGLRVLMRSSGLCLRSCGKGLGGIVMAIVVFIDGLHVVVRSGDMPRCRQMVMLACRVSSCVSHDEVP
jgi:hypothetical protein